MVVANKIKHNLIGIGKVLMLSLSFGYIFFRLQRIGTEELQNFFGIVQSHPLKAGLFLTAALFFAFGNWYLEIRKWQKSASLLVHLDFATAARQTLVAFSLSLATPARVGEYGVKALFFERNHRKKVMLLHLFSNATQLCTTIFFGIIGLIYFLKTSENILSFKKSMLFLSFTVIFFMIGLVFRKRKILINGLSLENVFRFFFDLPNSLKGSIFFLSVMRYIIFSAMFYFLLTFFGMSPDYYQAFLLIFCMYLLVSVVPTFFIFDVVIRGGVAVWLFSKFGFSDLNVLSTVGIMWVFNFVLPALFGSFWVFKFQPAKG